MEFDDEFVFLKLDILEKKNFTDENDKHFGVIDCIDKNNNPVRFFVFNSELLESVINAKFKRLQNVNVCFVLNYNSQRRNWNVNLKSIA